MKADTAGGHVEYVLDGKYVLRESGARTRRYHYGEGKGLSVDDGGGARWLSLDGLGSTSAEVTPGGSVTANRKHDAWGNYRDGTAPASGEVRLGYTGHQYDVETGLTYARARYYDSVNGVFLSRDTEEGYLNNAPSLHRYAYAHANPLRYTDPTGHGWFDPIVPAAKPLSTCSTHGQCEESAGEAAKGAERAAEAAKQFNSAQAQSTFQAAAPAASPAAGAVPAVAQVGAFGLFVNAVLHGVGWKSEEEKAADLAHERLMHDTAWVEKVAPPPKEKEGRVVEEPTRPDPVVAPARDADKGAVTEPSNGKDDSAAVGGIKPEDVPAGHGTIYKVPGSGTQSGKPYIGRHKGNDPAKNRKSDDGRDRTQADIVTTYDPNVPGQDRTQEQKEINKIGRVKKDLDNKRNERREPSWPEHGIDQPKSDPAQDPPNKENDKP